MNKKLLSLLMSIAAAATVASVSAANEPTIRVNERELHFEDQGPVIMEETGRTLMPLRFVLEECNATVEWNGETQGVRVISGDNLKIVELTIGSDQMDVYTFKTLIESEKETVTLEEPACLMNNRTMIPVRAVVEAIGSKVDWDAENNLINITSKAYMRYLRDKGLLDEEFNPITTEEGKEPAYDAKRDLPVLSLSTEAGKVAVGETFDVYVNLTNLDKVEAEKKLFTSVSLGVFYDDEVLAYDSYKFVEGETEKAAILDASSANFKGSCVKIVSIANYGNEDKVTTDGAIMKLTFTVLKDEPTELRISDRLTDRGEDTYYYLSLDGKAETAKKFSNVIETYLDTTPLVINAAEETEEKVEEATEEVTEETTEEKTEEKAEEVTEDKTEEKAEEVTEEVTEEKTEEETEETTEEVVDEK